MKRLYSIILLLAVCFIVSGCESDESKCAKSFNCVKIEDNSYRCDYCADGSQTCSNPSGVTCSSENK